MSHQNKKRGFSLAELLVVLAVMTIITGVVLAKYRGYGTNALFANATENIVLSIRQAQLYGVAVKGTTGTCSAGSQFDCSFGANFSVATPDRLTLFADNNNNGIFDAGDGSTQVVTWNSPIAVTAIACGGGACSGGVVNFTFKRPSPTAMIHDSGATTYTVGSVTLSDGVKTSTITVNKAGQISLQ